MFSLLTPLNINTKKASIPDDLDKKALVEFWQDSPLHVEVRQAFKKQLNELKEKNKELEDEVVDLKEKVAVNVSWFSLHPF